MNRVTDWQITFSDMLTLLLTLFVFIVSVSSFNKTEFDKLWKRETKSLKPEKASSKSFKFQLIKGIKMPVLREDAENLINDISELYTENKGRGIKGYYNENIITLMISEESYFKSGSSTMTEIFKSKIRELSEKLKKSKFYINIEGHTDSDLSSKYDNVSLSLDRALSVAAFMIREGVGKKRISVSGYGPYRPVASNETEDGRNMNRRVQINIIINKD